jgi:exopolysaccharide production protein ExoZ
MQKLRSLEVLRAVAVLLVVSYHTQIVFGAPTDTVFFEGIFSSGFRGVDLFFVLSGFIIAHVHASDIGRPCRLGNYVFNRTARIYPAVWIMTVLASGLSAAGFGIQDKAIKLGIWSVTAGVFLLPQAGDAIVNVTWSLKYELFFYLMFATLILNLRVGLALLIGWQAAVLLANICFKFESFGIGGFYLRSVCLEFSIGLACAWLIGQRNLVASMQAPAMQWVLLSAGTAAFVGGMLVGGHTRSTDIPCAFGAGAIIIGLVLLEQSARIRVPDVLVLLGSASYAIYLVHYSAISLLAVMLARVHVVAANEAMFLAAVASCVTAGVAFDQRVDQPVQRLLRERLKPALLGVTRQTISSPPREGTI